MRDGYGIGAVVNRMPECIHSLVDLQSIVVSRWFVRRLNLFFGMLVAHRATG